MKTNFRDVAQVVERYFREVEAAGSSPVIPMCRKSSKCCVYQHLGLFSLCKGKDSGPNKKPTGRYGLERTGGKRHGV